MSETTAAPTRTIQGVEVPAPGLWVFDKAHTTIGAIGRHMMVSKVRGRFKEYDGEIHVAEKPEGSWVEIKIQADSIDTGVQQRDDHLRSSDFMYVEKYPYLTFKSTKVEILDAANLRVTGDMTIRDVTRPVVLDVEYLGVERPPWGGVAAGFSATTELERADWDMTWNQALESGGVLVGKRLKVELEVEAVPKPENPAS